LIILARIVVVAHAPTVQIGAGHDRRPHRYRAAHALVLRPDSHSIGKCIYQHLLTRQGRLLSQTRVGGEDLRHREHAVASDHAMAIDDRA
jgi:hypothetical protein